MPKTLTLKNRQRIRDDIYAWSDAIVLQNACTMLSARKPPAQALVWGIIASKIELAMEAERGARNGHEPQPVEVELSNQEAATPPAAAQPGRRRGVEVELSNQEAAVLWKALTSTVQNEWYGRDQNGQPAPVPAGTLYLMLGDIAAQLGVEMPQPKIEETAEM